jgi:hypothetical protein
VVTAIAAVAIVAGCDAGSRASQPLDTPPAHVLQVLGATKLEADGSLHYDVLDLAGSSSVVGTTSFKLQFDRLLLPSTANRQAVCLQPKLGNVVSPKDCSAGIFLELSYDPVRREVTARQPPQDPPLAAATRYELTAYAAVADTDTGFRTFDGVGLEARAQYEFGVVASPGGVCGGVLCTANGAACTSASECCNKACVGGLCGGACSAGGATCSAPKDCCSLTCTNGTCATCKLAGMACGTATDCCGGSACTPPYDILSTADHFCGQPVPSCSGSSCARPVSILLGGCAYGSCHLQLPEAGAAEGMDLGSVASLLATAVGHPSHETQTGESARDPDQSGLRFGRAMPILDPGVPGASYLVYKLLANRTTPLTLPFPPDPSGDPTVDPPEVARLRKTLVVGMPMPPITAAGAAPLPGEAEWLSEWLLQGAPMPASGNCP